MRLSSKDQSKSLEYQESSIRQYCAKNELKIIGLFKDNGESSYTFDRPDYKALEAYLKKYKGECQYLIVLDHDRFSRNLPEALMKIAELERKYGVKVLSTSERIDLDTSDPDVFMKRAFDYMMANKELFNIRQRTKQGIRNAKEKGRYLGRAPFGYKNIIDGTKRNLIEIDKVQALIVERIFRDYISGIPLYIIHKNVKPLGFHHTGKSAIQSILENCVYAGLIKVPAFKDQPEKYAKALHEPIVSDAEFWLVQNMLKAGKRRTRVQPAEDFPLRGVLKCWCGKKMTAGWTKGRKEYYLYYRCIEHTNFNLKGPLLHETFEKVLKALSFQPHQITFLIETSKALLVEPLKLKQERLNQKLQALQNINEKIFKLEERLMNNEIEASTYKTWFQKFKEEKALLEISLEGKKKPKIDTSDDIIQRLLPELSNLYQIYEKSNITQKHMLIRGVFKDNLVWGSNMFRTTFINPIFEDNLLKIKEKGLLFYEQPSLKSGIIPLSTQGRDRTGTVSH
ncbi:recombinase family protein [Olivibacter jilunii]